jgi:hypothetical protein
MRFLGRLLPLLALALPSLASAAEGVRPWHEGTVAGDDVRAGAPLVTHVTVVLCDGDQLACGEGAGRPGDLEKNLY